MSDLILILPPVSASGGCVFLGASRVLADVCQANEELLVQDHKTGRKDRCTMRKINKTDIVMTSDD